MKKIISAFAIFAGLVLLAAPAFAQAPDCSDEGKAALYTEFTANRTTDSTKAYEAGKKYLGCSQTEDQYTAYLKKWITAYEKEARKIKMMDLFVNQRKYAEASAVAKEVLKDDPESLAAHIVIGYGGYGLAVTTKNEAGNAEAITFAKKAIQLIESGKTLENWTPFKSKDDALAYLNYSVGFLQRASNPSEALTYFIKSTQFDSEIKKNPQTYVLIAAAYENEYAKQSTDYEAKYKDKDETPESKLAVANINQLVDRIIDAFARAVSVAGTDAAAQASKTQWLARLTELYKFRNNNSDAGLTAMIASVMSKPVPPVPTPLTTLPATNPAASTAPASGGTTSTATGTASTTTPVTEAANSTKPASSTNGSTAPGKPKPRNNHPAARTNNRRR
jgi:hypothetical protein